jgi:hypothetical protein
MILYTDSLGTEGTLSQDTEGILLHILPGASSPGARAADFQKVTYQEMDLAVAGGARRHCRAACARKITDGDP